MADILICDDDLELGPVLVEWLRTLGHNGKAITQPEQAISELKSKKYSALILDQKMPNMTGKDVLVEVRKLFSPAELAVIFATGFGGKDLLVDVAKLGISTYLVKPIDMDQLAKKLPSMIPRRLTTDEVRAMLEKCHVADKSLSSNHGLSTFADRPNSLFSATQGTDKFVIASSGNIGSLRAHKHRKDDELISGVTIYSSVNNTWYRIWPTYWDLLSIKAR
jgi:DNA-binding response OmpR family regulator